MTRFHLAIAMTYILFAILLNSVGAVILQSILSLGVSKPQAATLEAFKDLSIAAASFLAASQLPRLGYRRAMLLGVLTVAIGCALAAWLQRFWGLQLVFATVGVSFALVKISVYASIGLLTNDQKSHASLLTLIEGVFMVGVVGGYLLFAAFASDVRPGSTAWMNVYWLLSGLAVATAGLIAISPLDEREVQAAVAGRAPAQEFAAMLALLAKPVVGIFIACVFFYVLIEQGIGTWLPTFNNQIIGLAPKLSVQMAVILAAGTAIGRFAAGALLRRMPWWLLLSICLIGTAALVLLALPLAGQRGEIEITSWLKAPAAAFVFPLIGVLLGPVYPTINSVMLSALPKPSHAPMTGLIVVFSALGGTVGSLLTGLAFASLGGVGAFYLTLVPIALLFVLLQLLRRMAAR